jgi:ATP/ADP translocase
MLAQWLWVGSAWDAVNTFSGLWLALVHPLVFLLALLAFLAAAVLLRALARGLRRLFGRGEPAATRR